MRVLAIAVIAFAVPLGAAELPAAPAGVVADAANLFSAADRTQLEALGDQVLRERAVALRVLTIADAKGEDPRAIAVRALNAWRVGPKSVLLLLVMNPRTLYLQPGPALASSFDAPTSAQICASIVAPQMRAKAFGAAALAGLSAIRDRIALPVAAPAAPVQPSKPIAAPTLAQRWPVLTYAVNTFHLDIVAGIALLAWPLYWVFSKVFARRCPTCRTRMSKWSRVTQPATFNDRGRGASTFTCGSCGHVETETYETGKRQWGYDSSSSTAAAGTWDIDNRSSSSSSSSSGSSDSGSSSDNSGGGGSNW